MAGEWSPGGGPDLDRPGGIWRAPPGGGDGYYLGGGDQLREGSLPEAETPQSGLGGVGGSGPPGDRGEGA